ncbi:TonB-dependent receptor domain-containing protein [Caulobacter segnis]
MTDAQVAQRRQRPTFSTAPTPTSISTLFSAHHLRDRYRPRRKTRPSVPSRRSAGAPSSCTASTGSDQSNLPAGVEFVTTRVYRNSGSFSTVNQAFYAQDQWSLFGDRLQVEAGVRNDRFDNRQTPIGSTFYDPATQCGLRACRSRRPSRRRQVRSTPSSAATTCRCPATCP